MGWAVEEMAHGKTMLLHSVDRENVSLTTSVSQRQGLEVSCPVAVGEAKGEGEVGCFLAAAAETVNVLTLSAAMAALPSGLA